MRRRGMNQEEFSKFLGISSTFLSFMLSGKRSGARSVKRIAKTLKLPIDYLIGREGQRVFEQPQIEITVLGAEGDKPLRLAKEKYFAVPLVEGRIAAGYSGNIPTDYVEGMVWVYKPEIGNRQHHNLRAVKLASDAHSMEPAIRPGDIVIIDPMDREITHRAIYAVRLDSEGGCAIKRVRVGNEYVLLISDNPEYEPIVILKDQGEHLIIGRVIWSWTSWVRP